MSQSFDELVDYDAPSCAHARESDVTAGDTPDGTRVLLCPDCGRERRESQADATPTASLASPVRYRRVADTEVVDTVDGRVTAEHGDYVVTHTGDGRARVMPGWLFEALYWPDPDPWDQP